MVAKMMGFLFFDFFYRFVFNFAVSVVKKHKKGKMHVHYHHKKNYKIDIWRKQQKPAA